MRIAIDFDDTVVEQDHAYDDLKTPLRFKPFAKDTLLSFKRAGHLLLLWSGRSSRSNLYDPRFDPLVRAGVVRFDEKGWPELQALNIARYHQMLDFVSAELPGVFDAIDDGAGGKPSVDLIIDNIAMRLGGGGLGLTWYELYQLYGEPEDQRANLFERVEPKEGT